MTQCQSPTSPIELSHFAILEFDIYLTFGFCNLTLEARNLLAHLSCSV
jgi:hypothetical protein